MDFLDHVFYGNSTRTWLIAVGSALATYALLRVLTSLLLRSLVHLASLTHNQFDDIAAEAIKATRGWFLMGFAFWAGTLPLQLHVRLREYVQQGVVLLLLMQMGIWGGAAIRAHVHRHTERNLEHDAAAVTTVRALGFLASLGLWSLLVLMALDNIGIDITALVAGLGIGGIAVALATQNILGDLFASLSIVLDKPFVYGDFIVVGDMAGTVEHVGLKTTRVRSLSGEQLIFSNSDLLQSRIRNFKRMQERRVVYTIGVVYQTTPTLLRKIPDIIREIVQAQPDVRFDRAHLKGFGASSVDFEVVFFVNSADFNFYMDRQQAIHLELFRRFGEEEIEFAYPTQTLYVATGVSPEEDAPGFLAGSERKT